ncbi:hypothetical protein R5H30_16635 [Sulfitobacter sp. D35]|uniref:hypothetical protein n=1 Tax=Sulfitobacter sp. D35 TaxID=3083252 RepID=UPI00296ECADF|nr:hypothetical protein [Sulfitobacter sp. D35]MDW4499622.1 hypothetical protein [Sulfitobacter sp. D35]
MQDKPRTTKLTIAPKHLLILLLPVVVLTVSEIMLASFADTDMDPGPVAIVEAGRMVELAGRYRFMAVWFFYSAVAFTFIAVFVADLKARHTWQSCCMTIVALIVVIFISLIFSVFEPAWMGSFEAYELLGAEIFTAALGVGHLPICAPGAPMEPRCGPHGAFFAMTFLLDKTNFIASFSTAAVIAGMVLALARAHPPELSTPDGLMREAQALETAQRTVRRYLYCSGILLTVGMMMGLAWMNWPADLIADKAQREEFRALVDSVSLFRGVSYSVLILSFYMPVSLILMVRIERFQTAAEGKSIPEAARSIDGFDIGRIGSMDAFKAVLSIIAPIIASAVGSFAGVNPFG